VEAGAWRRTSRTDTTFVLTANDPLLRYHRFFVAAIDNEGKPDPTPAALHFFARDDYMPEVWMLDYPHCETVGGVEACLPPPPDVDTLRMDGDQPILFAWSGRDRDGIVVGYAYKLDNEGYRWVGPDTTTALYPAPRFLQSGPHSFYLKARDDASAELSPSHRYTFVVNFDPDTVIDSLYYIPFHSSTRVPLTFDGGVVADTLPDGCSILARWHATDTDGEVRKSLVMVNGPDLQHGQAWSTGWMNYPDSTRFRSAKLEGRLQGPFVLSVFALDDRRRAEGTPARIGMVVNFPPVIETLEVSAAPSIVMEGGTAVDTVCVATFHWSATDPDAMPETTVHFFYKLDGRLILPPDTEAAFTTWSTEVSPGDHAFEVFAYNYDYSARVQTRSKRLTFEVDESCNLVTP
jgi:hypothetical protein